MHSSSSLTDDLEDEDVEEFAHKEKEQRNSDAAVVETSQQHATVLPSPPPSAPLAKYLARLNGHTEGEEEEAGGEEPHEDEEVPATTNEIPSSPVSSSSSVRWQMIGGVALEVVSPVVASIVARQHTLSYRSRSWCRREVVAALHTKHSTVSQQMVREHIHQRLVTIRWIYIAAYLLALVQVLFFGIQLFIYIMQHIPFLFFFIFQFDTSIILDWHRWHWLPFLQTIWIILAITNSKLASNSLSSVIAAHQFALSFIHAMHLLAATEHTSKRLILSIMERELVRRGYQLARGVLPPIERMEQQNMLAGGDGSDSHASRVRMAIQLALQLEIESMDAIRIQVQKMSLVMEAGSAADLNEDATTASSRASTLPSIVALKNLRTEWIDTRTRMLQQIETLIGEMEAREGGAEGALAVVSSILAPRIHRSALSTIPEKSLWCSFLRLNILLAQQLGLLEAFVPKSVQEGDRTTGASKLAPSSIIDPLSSSLPQTRRAFHLALHDANNTLRSAQQRVQLALERQLNEEPEKEPPVQEVQSTPSPTESLFQSITLPSLDDLVASIAPNPPVASSSPSAWTAPLSQSFASDIAYLRSLSKQLQRNADTLERELKRVDASEGVEREEGERRPDPPEPLVLAQSAAPSDADSGVTPADLLAAMSVMRKKTPSGMGALFEGIGRYEEVEFRPKRSSRPANGGGAPPAPAVSIFTILSELKCVLEQRKPAYEYFSHGTQEDQQTPENTSA